MLKLELTAPEQSLISEAEVVEQFLRVQTKLIFSREMYIPESCQVLSDLSVSL